MLRAESVSIDRRRHAAPGSSTNGDSSASRRASPSVTPRWDETPEWDAATPVARCGRRLKGRLTRGRVQDRSKNDQRYANSSNLQQLRGHSRGPVRVQTQAGRRRIFVMACTSRRSGHRHRVQGASGCRLRRTTRGCLLGDAQCVGHHCVGGAPRCATRIDRPGRGRIIDLRTGRYSPAPLHLPAWHLRTGLLPAWHLLEPHFFPGLGLSPPHLPSPHLVVPPIVGFL